LTDKFKLNDLLNEIKENCTEITYLSMVHLYEKIYKLNENTEVDKEEFLEIIKNYSLFFRYLNDYAGTIYRKYNSSIEIIYIELCSYYGLELDNEYRFEHILRKLEKQTPQLLMSLVDDDIQRQTVENFEEKLAFIKNSDYYKNNHTRLSTKIEKLEKNIALVKKALNFTR
jgi:hypothetical protein